MALSDLEPDAVLDAKGLTCPMPSLEAKQALKKMEAGQILKMELDYRPAAIETLPRFFKKAEVEFEMTEPEEGLWVYYIKR